MSPGPRIPAPGSARLFSDSRTPDPPAGVHVANIDGASRGNPGPAAYAVVLRDPNGKIILELAKKFGRDTNNVAEYYGLLAALDYAVTHGISALRIRSDSELLVRQMQGRYKVKSEDLRPLYERASKLSRQIAYFTIEHVRREMNSEADALANIALDGAGPGGTELRRESQRTGPADRSATRGAGGTTKSAVRVQARYERGVLLPASTLDLPEGATVTIEIHLDREK